MSALDTAQPTQTLSCLVYDPTVQDIDVLLDGLDAGCIPRAIAPGEDPMRVIGEVLERHRCQDLHLLGHGFPGGITLGGRQIDANAWQGFFQHTTVGDLITIAANHIQNQQINFRAAFPSSQSQCRGGLRLGSTAGRLQRTGRFLSSL